MPFTLCVLFLLFVFLMTTMLDIANLVVNYRIGLGTVGRMILYSIPYFLTFVLPMSTMLACLLTVLSMSTDNEIIALKAGGISLYRLMPPILLFCLLGFIITSTITVYGVPWGKNAIRDLLLEMNTTGYSALLEERTFINKFKGITIFISKVNPKTNTVEDVFIEDRNNPGIVITTTAPHGQVIDSSKKNAFHLRLTNGFISQVRLEDQSSHAIQFETYDIRLSMNQDADRAKTKDEDEMSFSELKDYINTAKNKDERYYEILLELHKKFSLPFACISLGILAIPLGLQSKSAKRSFGVGLGLIVFLLYYLMLAAGWVFGEAGMYPPVIGMWLPNVVMGGAGILLLIRSANERSSLFDKFGSLFKWETGSE